jgi:hypothetical protein
MKRRANLGQLSSATRETEQALAAISARLNGIIASAMAAIISVDARRQIDLATTTSFSVISTARNAWTL